MYLIRLVSYSNFMGFIRKIPLNKKPILLKVFPNGLRYSCRISMISTVICLIRHQFSLISVIPRESSNGILVMQEESPLVKKYLAFFNKVIIYHAAFTSYLSAKKVGYQGLVYRIATESLRVL